MSLPSFSLCPPLPLCASLLPPSTLSCAVSLPPSIPLTPVPLALLATLAFGALVYAWETYLNARQARQYADPSPPSVLFSTVSSLSGSGAELSKTLEGKFSKAQSYGADKVAFSTASATYDLLLTSAQHLLGFLPYTWSLALSLLARYTSYTADDEIVASCAFFLLSMLASELTSLPTSLYSTFGVERKHGFNKTTPLLYIKDWFMSFSLTAAIGCPFLALLLWIIKSSGPLWFWYAWGMMVAFTVLMLTVYPVFIMPLFNKYEPLPEGELKKKIFELAGSINYPLTKLFIVDGSKRSSHSNAYMFGFGKNKRIVLFDTLVAQVDEGEILSILGHELGHWALYHTVINFVITQTYFLAAFYIFSLCYESGYLYSAFGFGDDAPVIIRLLLFMSTVWSPVDKVLGFLLTINSRYAEFAADRYSINLGMKDLQSGLTKIHIENLGSMKPDPWYSTYHYSHPPLVERLVAMQVEQEKYDQKQKKKA